MSPMSRTIDWTRRYMISAKAEGHGDQEPGPNDAQAVGDVAELDRHQDRVERPEDRQAGQHRGQEVADQIDDRAAARRQVVDQHVDADVRPVAHGRAAAPIHTR